MKTWRAAVLATLFLGPYLAYVGFGAFWLWQHGWAWIYPAAGVWLAASVAFGILLARWTRGADTLLPPIDWDAPQTFAPKDHRAWEIVQEEAVRADALPMEQLTGFDLYVDTGRRLTRKLAEHYHPHSADPIDHVPVVEMLTALQLAAEDLDHLCRQVPGGDLVTPGHWKRAVVAAGYIQKANDLYGWLLPILNPITGIPRLAAQRYMVKPAWRNMQENLLRWFYRAYVNRLGVHFVELYSGRLAIGAARYRKLTRKAMAAAAAETEAGAAPRIALAGARSAQAGRVAAALKQARSGDPSLLKSRLVAAGLPEALLDQLEAAEWVETPGYTSHAGGENARDRQTRREAIEAALGSDLLILVVDGRDGLPPVDAAFARDWDGWHVAHPEVEAPPALVLASAGPGVADEAAKPEILTSSGATASKPVAAAAAHAEAIRSALPPTFAEVVAVDAPGAPYDLALQVVPALGRSWPRVERLALIRVLRSASSKSTARRLAGQLGRQGMKLWGQVSAARQGRAKAPAAAGK